MGSDRGNAVGGPTSRTQPISKPIFLFERDAMAIYFIQCGKNGPIKIGQTENDIKERIRQLQTGCPYELRLLWVYTGSDYDEKDVHGLFEHERIRGEWFHPSLKLIRFIDEELCNHFEIHTKNGNFIGFTEFFKNPNNLTTNDYDFWIKADKKIETYSLDKENFNFTL